MSRPARGAVGGAEVITFGCRLNSLESEIMRSHAQGAGLGDVVVVHTCAVTGEAERQARQAIRRARRERPAARIVVTGCSAQIDPVRYGRMAEVDHVVGNRDKLDPATWRTLAGADAAPVMVSDPTPRATAHHLVDGLDGRSRALVQIQQGCDHRCTFCIIPLGRGPSRSLPVGEVVTQARRLVEGGYREVVLTGVDIASWGKDLPGRPGLGQLVRRLLRLVPELPRLRLSSLDPAVVDAELRRLLAEEPRLMPHLHLSVQAGDDLTLKRMRRRHRRADVLRLCAELRTARPEIAFGADLIAGFPTETEAMFESTLRLVEEADISYLHVFPYSVRHGTAAARMPQVTRSLRRERAARLRDAGGRALGRQLQRRLGQSDEVLIEHNRRGHTRSFAPFRFADRERVPPPGEIVRVRADGIEAATLIGRAVP